MFKHWDASYGLNGMSHDAFFTGILVTVQEGEREVPTGLNPAQRLGWTLC